MSFWGDTFACVVVLLKNPDPCNVSSAARLLRSNNPISALYRRLRNPFSISYVVWVCWLWNPVPWFWLPVYPPLFCDGCIWSDFPAKRTPFAFSNVWYAVGLGAEQNKIWPENLWFWTWMPNFRDKNAITSLRLSAPSHPRICTSKLASPAKFPPCCWYPSRELALLNATRPRPRPRGALLLYHCIRLILTKYGKEGIQKW